MLFRVILLLSSFGCCASIVEAQIIETQYIEDIVPLVDKDTWVLVDLDNCMFQGAQALGHANWFYDAIQQKIAKGISKNTAIAEVYPDWIQSQNLCTVQPIEKNFVPILTAFQNQGIVVMGLTHRCSNLEAITIRQVNSLNFNFFKTAPTQTNFNVPTQIPGFYSHGILFVGDFNKKSDVFARFLALINKFPEKIVFIDDRRDNVEDLERLTNQSIKYTGVHYTAIQYASPIFIREIAELQYKTINHIISNEAALLLLEHGLE
ncbi:DUF2608 domain-containing protein [Candidatus Chlamydia sanziniae]|uniref:Outer membrane protein n=1 Tax=Candidatus Chlamydia sanziniae TaxID=1806891 RepID=A0A1A9HWE2_9CHLA|nr:DUF2608 domain-containing protein [Candidatus Chlamydia sanziniae]ANH78423.1 hypothetical protein Cs308_0252 [Candidatus Chlamydia sanziniae]